MSAPHGLRVEHRDDAVLATTVWEAWEGIDEDGVAHDWLNHYSKGGVISFLHQYVAGIQRLDEHPGYRRFRIAPRPSGGLTWARGLTTRPTGASSRPGGWRVRRCD